MEFFRMQTPGELDASPYSVKVNGLSLSYKDEDAFPFIVYKDNVVFGAREQEHDDLECRYGRNGIELEGRYWINKKVIAVWSYAYDDRTNEQEQIRRLANALRSRLGLNTNRISIYLDLYVGKTEEHDGESFIVGLTLNEYLSTTIPGDPNEYFWHIMHKNDVLSKETGVVSKNGMLNKDIWRHYEVDEVIKLDRNDLKRIVENVIKEYHQGQQLVLPFDGSDEPYNDMQFMEWVEKHGEYGKLPSQPNAMEEVMTNKMLFDVGESTFFYGTGEEFDNEYFHEVFSKFVDTNGGNILFNDQNDTVDNIVDNIDSPNDVLYYLNENAQPLWYNYIVNRGRETMDWWIQNRLEINADGLIYCERMIAMEKARGRYHSEKEEGDMDYYQMLDNQYSGIGVYWSYAHGGGQVYFYNTRYGQEVLIRGWVSPDSVDWEKTISLDSMDEQELRLYGDATVQIDSMEIWTPESGKVNLLGNRGSILMKTS